MEGRDVEQGWWAGVEFAVLVKSLCGSRPLGKQLDNMAAAQGKNGLKIGVSGSIVCREQSEPQE